MATIKSSAENLTLNADGSGNDILFQSNGSQVGSLTAEGVFTATSFAGSGASLTALNATQLTSGTVPTARLGSGTASSSTFLRGDNSWATAGVAGISSSADATAITINSDETVGIGVTPETTHSTWTALQVGGTGNLLTEKSQAAGGQFVVGQNVYMDAGGDFTYIVTDEASYYRQYSGTHVWRVAASGSADASITWGGGMSINNEGTWRVSGTGSDPSPNTGTGQGVGNGGLIVDKSGGMTMAIQNQNSYFNFSGTAGDSNWKFRWGGSDKGSIVWNSSSTSYNTSSDYRLKENVDYTWDATTRLKQLKPARFNWINDDTNTLLDGFLAHEVSSVVPEAITGTKDATETYTDDEGNEQTRIAPQSIDQAKLVPLLVKTIQELEARITALEA